MLITFHNEVFQKEFNSACFVCPKYLILPILRKLILPIFRNIFQSKNSMFFPLSAFILPLMIPIFCSIHSIFAVKCMNCRTLEEQLICDDPCEGDICALWSFREMSMDHVLQGCLTGPDLRESSSLRMGCRRNRVDALLCLCNSDDLCNMDESTAQNAHPISQPILPTEIQCHSRTSASFIRRQMVKPPRHQCLSDFCFFTQTNSTAISADDPLGQPPIIESTTSRNCGPQLEFNFDILLGPVWPGNGLHSEACYRLETGKDRLIGCSCSNNGCNRLMPYPIDIFQWHPQVKCHLGPQYTNRPTNWTMMGSSRSFNNPFCRGHFCFVQKETFHGYGDHWTSGCLSANESAANARLKVGYRNILGIEQWLCATDFCNGPILRRQSSSTSAGIEEEEAEEGTKPWGDEGGRTVDGPIGIGRGKTAGRKAEGGRVQAQKQAMAKKRKQMERTVAFGGGTIGQSSSSKRGELFWHWHCWQLLFSIFLLFLVQKCALFC